MRKYIIILLSLCLLLSIACQKPVETEPAFHIKVKVDVEGVYELQQSYTVNGIDEGCGGVRNADGSLLDKGEELRFDFCPSTFSVPDDYTDFSVTFTVIDEKRDAHTCVPLSFSPVVSESYSLLLSGSFDEGFSFTWR